MRKYSYVLAYLFHLVTCEDGGSTLHILFIALLAIASAAFAYTDQNDTDRYFQSFQSFWLSVATCIIQSLAFVGLWYLGYTYSFGMIAFYVLWPFLQVVTFETLPMLSKKSQVTTD